VPIGGAGKLVAARPFVTLTVLTGGKAAPLLSRTVNTTWLTGPVTVALTAKALPATMLAATGPSTKVRTTACAVCPKEKRCAALRRRASAPTAPSSVRPVPSAVPDRTGSSASASAAWRITRSPGFSMSATGAK
jgi:hypothetical protein